MSSKRTIIALDVGEKRIGVAQADMSIGIAVPYDVIEVDGNEVEAIIRLVILSGADTVVVGYPRNQSGEPTAQSTYVENFVATLQDIDAKIVYQDESLTSVLAEQQLEARKKPYAKGDVDMIAASLILDDYLETHR
ncbi:MAG TPA: Holliday junction resolvase RuvX [Patescibacteria group bacterium]|jgi:putative Holliday junction resolvase|nr:Holliday junction resolvase RuvX [Patescibacteria group bacterium]